MSRPGFPKSLREFQRRFASEEACQQYLAASRWPDGFQCPRCGHGRAYRLARHQRWRGVAGGSQASLTAGTVLHNTKLPLTVWFWAAYLMTTDTRGISAFLLQRHLGLRRYETAWMLLHKLRRAMVNLAREPGSLLKQPDKQKRTSRPSVSLASPAGSRAKRTVAAVSRVMVYADASGPTGCTPTVGCVVSGVSTPVKRTV